jgi:hypothetical protein
MRGVYWTLSLVLIGTVCLAQAQQPNLLASASSAMVQEPATDQHGRASVTTGERTVVGCVTIAAPGPGYVLKADDGRTIQLRGGTTDLAPYMGKKVQIHTSWTSKGIHVAAPVETQETVAAGAATGGAQTSQEFAGSLQLQFQGKVLGDCLPGKKK